MKAPAAQKELPGVTSRGGRLALTWLRGTAATQGRRREAWLYALLAGLLLFLFCARIPRVTFQPDESQWIATSTYLEVFLRGDYRPESWAENYWTLTQPPLTRYVIGVGRRLGGYGPSDLNGPWDWSTDGEENVARGNAPSLRLLWWSRLPMAILAVVSGLVLFRCAVAAAGRPAGYVFLILYASSSYLATTLGRAMAESVLLACISLAILAGERGLACWGSPKGWPRFLAWLGAVGALAGAAANAKLNGGAVVLTGLALCALVGLRPGAERPGRRAAAAATAGCLLLLVAALAFVLLNPYLYADPVGHALRMVQQRAAEMQLQRTKMPASMTSGWSMRLRVVLLRVLETYAGLCFPGAWVFNLVLTLLGAGMAALGAWRWWVGRGGTPAEVVLLLAALTTATPSLLTPIDWDRYYLLPVVFSTLFVAIGMGRAVAAVEAWVSR